MTEPARPSLPSRLVASGPAIGAGLAIAMPTALAVQVLTSKDGPSGAVAALVTALYAVAVAVTGAAIGRGRSTTPTADAALAGIVVYAVVQLIALARLLTDDATVTWIALPFFGAIAAAIAVATATVARSRRPS